MSINKNYDTNYDDSYKDVLSALSELDDTADIDYVKENYKYERTNKRRHRRMDFRPLQHAAKFLSCLIPKKCA
ncbi:MAG: hypothetical protein K1W34_16940 [Lachnospiraceae bacterium]